MRSRFYDYASRIDELIRDYSLINLRKIESFFIHEGAKDYFFKKLASSEDPLHWLKPLKEKGYFNPENNPKPQEVSGKPGFCTIPHWNVLDYLENVANKNKEEPLDEITNTLVEIVNSIISYKDNNNERIDNYRIDWVITKIISTFPIERLEDQHVEFIRTSLKSRWNSTLVAGSIGKTVLPMLIAKKAKAHILKLLDIMLDFEKREKPLIKFMSIMDDYWLNVALKKYKLNIIELCGLEAAEIVLRKMESIISMGSSRFNYMWVPTIEDHPQNRHTDKYECILVYFVRDIFEQSDGNQIKATVKELLRKEHPVFKRIAVHLINRHYEELNDLFWTWDGNPLNEIPLKHEIYELLRSNSSVFNDVQLDKILEWIESKNYYLSNDINDIKDDEDKKNKILAYRKLEWLSALMGANKPKVVERYKRYQEINPAEIDHPGFDYWMETWVGDVSPIKEEDLCTKTNLEIAEYIKNFKAEGGWQTPTKEGLCDTFRNCMSNNPDKFSSDLEPFLDVSRMYQHSLLMGLWEAWKTRKIFEWWEVLSFILRIIESDNFWEEAHEEDRCNYQNMIISRIAELINEGTKDDSHAFNPDFLSEAEKILLILASKTKTSLPETGDLITSVLNSTRGTIFVAMVNYSLRYARLYKRDQTDRWVDSIMRDFEKRLNREYEPSLEFSVVIGKYLPNLYYLNKEWVIDNINKIFLKDNEIHWNAAFEGYLSYADKVYKDIYFLLRENGHYSRAIKTEFKDEYVMERLIQHICIGYIEGWENIENEGSLIFKLFENNYPTQLSEIVSFFWMKRDILTDKTKIKPLWKLLTEIALQNINQPNYQNIISDLSKWLSLIDEIDDEVFEWLKISARYVEVNDNTSFFIEYLLRHVNTQPGKVGMLYLEMLNSEIYPDYDKEDIKSIVQKLYEGGQKEIADRICNLYGEKGYDFDFLRELYERYKKIGND